MKEALKAARVIAIVRGDYVETIHQIAGALLEGGVTAVEVTMNSRGALGLIETLAKEYGETMLVGAGTVVEVEHVRQAHEAGARFIVSPDTFPEVIRAALDCGMEPIPGAFTPTEIRTAQRAGARLVKLFPASLGGPNYMRQIRAPLSDVDLIPTGGVSLENAADFLRAGGVALGLGSVLLPSSFDGSAQAVASLTERARRLMEIVRAVDREKQRVMSNEQ